MSSLIEQFTIRSKYRKYKKSNYKGSGEKLCRKIFEELTGVEFISCRPDFLRNPLTGFNLELDGYNQEFKLAFEFQGQQHYQKNIFNPTDKDLEYQQWKDNLKKELCLKNGIILIEIPYTEFENNNLKFFIKNNLLKNI